MDRAAAMKRISSTAWLPVVILVCLFPVLAAGQTDPKFGDTRFMTYEGEQRWPTAEHAESIDGFAVPIYVGLPTRKYRVLGRIYDPRTSGIAVVGRAFAEGLFSERDRQRDCANQARYRGATAVLVTDDERILKALGLSADEIEDTAPLFQHKGKIVLAIVLD
jgi:hypothetical protein